MSKRTLLMVLALVASVALAATGTLAYLTDTDSDVNVMTLGNVDIEQHEMKRADGIAYNATLEDGDLLPFEDGIKLFPAYPVEGAESPYTAASDKADCLKWGPYVHTGTSYNGLWDDEKLVGAVDKMVFVENTGSSPAYFRTLIAFEYPEGVVIGPSSEGTDIIINDTSLDLYKDRAARYSTEIEVDGVRYIVWEYVYQDALLPGEWSHPSLLQVVMTHNADNETMELLGETYEILALTQAVQVENLDKLGAEGALDAAFGDVTKETAEEWFGGVASAIPVTVSTPAELKQALADGKTSIKLGGDITFGDGDVGVTDGGYACAFPIQNGGSVTIDLNGHDITVDTTEPAIVFYAHDTDLTITGDGNVHQTTDDNMFWCKGDSTLTVLGGNYTSDTKDSAMFYSSGNATYDATKPYGTINVYGGTFTNNCEKATDPTNYANVMNHGVGKVNYYGGTYNWHPENVAHADDAAHINVAEGCTVTDNGNGTYTVQ